MKIRRRKDSYPRWAKDMFPDVSVEAWDLRYGNTGPRHKVCFFKTRKDLRYAWNRLLDLRDGGHHHQRMGRAMGFVHQCWHTRWSEAEGERMMVDRRYASIVCILIPGLSHEIICHEAVHAGLAHLRRLKRDPDPVVHDMDAEEELAYPTGWMASKIIGVARDEGWLPK